MESHFRLLPEAVQTLALDSRQQVLEHLAAIFARAYGLDREQVLEGLEERERLGSTGFGEGVAIPHARLAQIDGPVAALIRLESPVDFAAADGVLVDLVFGLVSPNDAGAAHLHALAEISRIARDEAMHRQLAHAADPEVLYSLIANRERRDAA